MNGEVPQQNLHLRKILKIKIPKDWGSTITIIQSFKLYQIPKQN